MRRLALFALSAFVAGCSLSHTNRDAGERCGPIVCAAGTFCCNESCGICVAPGGSCTELACVDAGGPAHCGAAICGFGEECCADCDGDPFCHAGPCPILGCPPPPPGCDECGLGERCCPTCPGSPSVCVGGAVCPDVECPPPAECESCAPGALCCPSCPGAASFCGEPGWPCPSIEECPSPTMCDELRRCDGEHYCDRESCGGEGVCVRRPDACTDDCPGVCGCDGTDYCNACDAAVAGVDVAHAGPCGACSGRDYCDCSGGCEPLIDLSTGCICPCDDPFNCTGELCACACGGATYLGCADVGRCAETEVHCGPGCSAILDSTGCPACVCATPD